MLKKIIKATSWHSPPSAWTTTPRDFPNGQDADSKGFRYPSDFDFTAYENNTANFLVLFSDAKFQVSDVIPLERGKYVTSASGEMYTNYKWQERRKRGVTINAPRARQAASRHQRGTTTHATHPDLPKLARHQ